MATYVNNRIRPLLVMIGVAGSLFAQSLYPKHNLTIGFGAGLPGEDLARPFKGRPALSFAYGYRFQHYLQADAGVDTVFGAASIRAYMETVIGPTRIRDFQFFIPVGGRVVLPLGRERFLISAGGGGAYFHYTELLNQPSEEIHLACPVCNARSGWGYYGLVGADLFLDRGRNFRLGATSKLYRGQTTGTEFGAVPGIRTQDRWLQIFAHIGFSF